MKSRNCAYSVSAFFIMGAVIPLCLILCSIVTQSLPLRQLMVRSANELQLFTAFSHLALP